ncbi:MAG: hypothetical protein ABEH80_00580, partial [Halobaculum sp.]
VSAHDAGIPALSPATTQLKKRHAEQIAPLLEKHDIPTVYVINDTDPVSASEGAGRSYTDAASDLLSHLDTETTENTELPVEEGDSGGGGQFRSKDATTAELFDSVEIPVDGLKDRPETERQTSLREVSKGSETASLAEVQMEARPLVLDPGETESVVDDPEAAVRELLDEEAPDRVATELAETFLRETTMWTLKRPSLTAYGEGPIKMELSIEQYGPGEVGGLTMVEELRAETKGEVETRMLLLPQYGPDGMDFDDYIQGGWLQLLPPADWVLHIQTELDNEAPAVSLISDSEKSEYSWITQLAVDGTLTPDPVYEKVLSRADRRPRSSLEFDPDYRRRAYQHAHAYTAQEDGSQEESEKVAKPAKLVDEHPTLAHWSAWSFDATGIEDPEDVPRREPPQIGSGQSEYVDETVGPRTIPEGPLTAQQVPLGAAARGYDQSEEPTGERREESDGDVEPGVPYGAAGMFGMVPTLTPKYHPEFTQGTDRRRTHHTPNQDNFTPEESTITPPSGGGNPLFEIKVGDVWNVPPGYRGEHPLGGYGNSGNFYKAYSDKWHYDFKSKTLYDGTLALAVDIGLRNKTTVSQGNYTDKELFKMWLEAKRRGLIPKDAAIPARGLNYYAVSRGLCDRDELVAVDQTDGSEDEDSTFAGLPAGVYNDAVDKLYREFDVNPGLGQKETDADDDEPTDDPDTSDSDTDVTES